MGEACDQYSQSSGQEALRSLSLPRFRMADILLGQVGFETREIWRVQGDRIIFFAHRPRIEATLTVDPLLELFITYNE